MAALTVCASWPALRNKMLGVLEGAGFRCIVPQGAYYIMTDISGFGFADDMAFVRHLIENIGVAAVPGSSFFNDPRDGAQMVRFCFCNGRGEVAEVEVRGRMRRRGEVVTVNMPRQKLSQRAQRSLRTANPPDNQLTSSQRPFVS